MPLKVSANGRFLQREDGSPFFDDESPAGLKREAAGIGPVRSVTRLLTLFALLMVMVGVASAERQKLSVAVTYGLFRPASSATRRTFGDTWGGLSVAPFRHHRKDGWRPIFDLAVYQHERQGRATLVPLTVGAERSIGDGRSVQPYVALRVGPYYGRVRSALGERDSGLGFDANASLGVTFRERFFVEARYDYFTRFAGSRFDGLSVSAGVRLFDVRL